MALSADPRQNQRLAALPPAEWQRSLPLFEPVALPLGQVLYASGQELTHVCFPTVAEGEADSLRSGPHHGARPPRAGETHLRMLRSGEEGIRPAASRDIGDLNPHRGQRASRTSPHLAEMDRALTWRQKLPKGHSPHQTRVSVVEQQFQNDTGGDCHENVVTASLNPVVSARRRTEVVAAPIIDHVLPVTVFGGQAVSPSPATVRACRPPVGSRAFVAISSTPVTTLVLPVITTFHLLLAPAVIAISMVLGNGEAGGCQSNRHDSGNNDFALHSGPR